MAHFPLASLLDPGRAVVVGDGSVRSDDSLPIERIAPDRLADGEAAVDGAALAVVTSAASIDRTVPALVDAGVDAILVTADVPDRPWFELVEVAVAANVALLGPNARLGRPESGLFAGVDDRPTPGPIAMVASSAETLAAMAAEGVARGLGVDTLVATGTGGTVGPAAVLDALDAAGRASVILALPDRVDRAFVRAAESLDPAVALAVHAPRWACADRPVPVGDDLVVQPGALRDAVLEQAGVLGVDSVDRLLDLAPALAHQPLPAGDRVAIVSNAGGPGVMATDAVGTSRLEMATFEDETVERLEAVIPDRAFPRNPLDLLADSGVEVFRGVLDAVFDDPGVDAAIVISAPNPLYTFEELAEVIADARSRHDSPIVGVLMGGESVAGATAQLRSVGIPNYFDPFQAVQVIATLADQRDVAAARAEPRTEPIALPTDDLADLVDDDADTTTILEAAAVPVAASADGVSVTVAGMVTESLGPIVAVGIGEYAPILGDVGVRVGPIAPESARTMLDALDAAPLLRGARGTDGVDVDALGEVIARLSALPDARTRIDAVSARVLARADGAHVVSATHRPATDHQ